MHHATILVKPVGAHTAADDAGEVEARDIHLVGTRIADRRGVAVIRESYANMQQK